VLISTMMMAVEDIGDDPIALATRGKHCLNEIVSLFSHLFTQFENMDKLGGDTQSLEEAKNKYFAEMQQLKDIITKLKNYQNLNQANLKTDPPDTAMLQERDALRKEAYEKNQFMKQLITQLREMMFDLNTVTSGIPM